MKQGWFEWRVATCSFYAAEPALIQWLYNVEDLDVPDERCHHLHSTPLVCG